MPLFPLQIDDSLELREPHLAHTKALFQILETYRQELGQWMLWVNQMSSEEKVARFIRESQAFNTGGQKLILFIFLQNKLVGSVALLRIDKVHQKAEMGYWLSPEYQGQGIIVEICAYFIQLVFKQSALHRIEIKTSSGNHKSKAIPLKLGFQYEGTLREDLWMNEKYHDIEIFSLLKKDLEKI